MTEVFEKDATLAQWDDDYYPPIALKLYDWAVADLLQNMEVEPGAIVLDGGCGPGVHSIRVAKAGYRVCAIDISRRMLDEAKKRAEAAEVAHRIEFAQKDLTKLDFPDHSFPYVFSWGVIIHIPEGKVQKALDELMRIVEPGGKLALYITNKTAIDHKIEALLRGLSRKPLTGLEHYPLGDGIWYEMNDQKLWLWRFDAKAIIDYVTTRGFTLKHRHVGEFTEIQRRLKGSPRNWLLRLNNLAYRLNWSLNLASTTLFIFEKKKV